MTDSTHNIPAAPLLSIRDLTIALPRGGDRPHAVKDISFDIRAGEILCIVGESGSGKSMSANAIMGLLPDYLRPQGGQIMFDGRDLLQLDEDTLRGMRGREMAMIFQEPLSALNPLQTVGDQIDEVMRVHNVGNAESREKRVLDLLEFVGLPEPATLRQAWPFRLSGGQRQRVMIAMALALEPRLLIADEPTTALDVTTQAQILALIARIQREKGMGVMFVTHDFGVVAEIADRVAVMEKGILVEEGPAEQVLNRPRHPYTRRLIAAVPSQQASAGERRAAGPRPVLQVKNLNKVYATGGGLFHKKRVVHAVNDVSFSVGRGQTLGIVGESGSGKSTIGKCLLKLLDIDGGQMLFDGQDIAPLPEAQFRAQRCKIQMIFQDPFASLNPRQTVGRILCDGPLANGVSRQHAEERARELLKLVELDPSAFDRYPVEFSGGQRQRIGIARALAMEPQLIVADESVSALDVSVQAQVLKLLQDVQQRLQLALIFITHDLRVAAQICDHLLVMHRGRVVEQGPPAQIFDNPQDPYTRQLIAAMPGRDWDPTAAITTDVNAAATIATASATPALAGMAAAAGLPFNHPAT
ncbi:MULTISPECIES: ABC transporter ATP-binding protein [unclassified Achromobacter]|uniref:ABC transporter ATP-binding protein n=1 Tax=unclassified Achromobacter TaxID=2626865 RepID=UPI000B516743|nr:MULTISPECIES: ABC transporter ATP-binding protein [unclassified Achromobacter]OWT80170.1 ABC transporter ATP-binding protein [Achromobacter sp. HZ34]OWT82053.1 ABC transporter ATP-binding protein [Achromobacter sp. HZ28]